MEDQLHCFNKAVILANIMEVHTHDMHTGGEPLRIIRSGVPELKGSTILAKREYAKTHLDHLRKFLMNEPRGHKDMYGAILEQKESKNEFFTLFIHNEGYSSMCGHGVIALGRYVVDFGLVTPISPKTEVIFDCPCGPVKTSVSYENGSTGLVSFESVPAFVYKQDVTVDVPSIGKVIIDIAFGGAFYVFTSDKNIGLDIKSSPLPMIIERAAAITDAVKENIPICHPISEQLSFLYGTIITDGKDGYSDGPTTNICVFADKQVDRSPTGSGVTARIAIQMSKGFISLNQEKEFKSLIGSSFIGKAVRAISLSSIPCVIVEVSGKAHHTGDHLFYLEEDDTLKEGFQLPR